ncbi:MAG: hypothetical protein ABIG64_01420 [Candidatus Omnitrophota bacterium]
MNWKLLEREDSFEGSDQPFISISTDHFSFNAMFSRLAELGTNKRVKIYADHKNLKIGFEFVKNNEKNSYSLSRASAAEKGKKRVGLNCASKGIIKKYSWLKAVASLPDAKDRRFYPKKENSLWVIQLCPAFEEKKARESADIPSDAVGIYRYVRENGEVVYIGRGHIKNRLNSGERDGWDFDRIEYSIVNNPDEQVNWETFWLEKYKENNNGKLPIYNKLSGFEKKS